MGICICNLDETNTEDYGAIIYRLASGCVACWGYFDRGCINAYPCEGLEECINLVCNEKGKLKMGKKALAMRKGIKRIEDWDEKHKDDR